eukprot:g838.t1
MMRAFNTPLRASRTKLTQGRLAASLPRTRQAKDFKRKYSPRMFRSAWVRRRKWVRSVPASNPAAATATVFGVPAVVHADDDDFAVGDGGSGSESSADERGVQRAGSGDEGRGSGDSDEPAIDWPEQTTLSAAEASVVLDSVDVFAAQQRFAEKRRQAAARAARLRREHELAEQQRQQLRQQREREHVPGGDGERSTRESKAANPTSAVASGRLELHADECDDEFDDGKDDAGDLVEIIFGGGGGHFVAPPHGALVNGRGLRIGIGIGISIGGADVDGAGDLSHARGAGSGTRYRCGSGGQLLL